VRACDRHTTAVNSARSQTVATPAFQCAERLPSGASYSASGDQYVHLLTYLLTLTLAMTVTSLTYTATAASNSLLVKDTQHCDAIAQNPPGEE